MKNNFVKTEILVKETKVGVMRIGNTNYISLTDLSVIICLFGCGPFPLKFTSSLE